MACRYLRLHSVLKIFYQVDVLVLRGSAEFHKAIGGGYAEVIHVARLAWSNSGWRAYAVHAEDNLGNVLTDEYTGLGI